MLYLDYLAYHNRFYQVSILEKLSLGLGGTLLATTTGNPAACLTIFLVMSAILLRAGMPLRYWLRLWLTLLPFLFMAVATILFSVSLAPFTALWQLRLGPLFIGVTGAGLADAQAALLRSAAATACLLMLAGTTPVSYFVAWAARIECLRPVLEVALLAYRFIFVVLHTAAQIYTAQQSRLGYSNFMRSLRSITSLAANLGRKSFMTARDLYVALLSRNYSDRLVFRYPAQQTVPWRMSLILAGWIFFAWLFH